MKLRVTAKDAALLARNAASASALAGQPLRTAQVKRSPAKQEYCPAPVCGLCGSKEPRGGCWVGTDEGEEHLGCVVKAREFPRP